MFIENAEALKRISLFTNGSIVKSLTEKTVVRELNLKNIKNRMLFEIKNGALEHSDEDLYSALLKETNITQTFMYRYILFLRGFYGREKDRELIIFDSTESLEFLHSLYFLADKVNPKALSYFIKNNIKALLLNKDPIEPFLKDLVRFDVIENLENLEDKGNNLLFFTDNATKAELFLRSLNRAKELPDKNILVILLNLEKVINKFKHLTKNTISNKYNKNNNTRAFSDKIIIKNFDDIYFFKVLADGV